MGKPGFILPYKPARVYNGEKEWFVEFWWWCLNREKYIREKVRLGIKGITAEQRQPMLEELCKELNVVLKQRNLQGIYHEEIVTEKKTAGASKLDLVDWMEKAKFDQTIPESTRKSIGYVISAIGRFYEQHPVFTGSMPDGIGNKFAANFVRTLKDEGKAGKTINAYLGTLDYVQRWMKKEGVISKPFALEEYRVKQVKNETERYRPLTQEQKELMFEYFREKRPDFFLYLLFIYYTCIRPSELRRLKIENINLAKRSVYVPWYSSKNGLSNYVQILDPLAAAIEEFGVAKKPKGYFLFGPGFAPAKEEFSGINASDIWREGCRKAGVEDWANMYALKHTFNVDYIENNRKHPDWEWLRNHNRHATIQQTQDYIRDLTPFFLDETQAVILDYFSRDSDKVR